MVKTLSTPIELATLEHQGKQVSKRLSKEFQLDRVGNDSAGICINAYVVMIRIYAFLLKMHHLLFITEHCEGID